METFPALLALCAGNSLVTFEFPSQRPVTRSFDVFLDLRLNKRLSKHSRRWWFETPSHTLWRQCDEATWWHKCYYLPWIIIRKMYIALPSWNKLVSRQVVNPLISFTSAGSSFHSVTQNAAHHHYITCLWYLFIYRQCGLSFSVIIIIIVSMTDVYPKTMKDVQ